jgi:hypothetical protein
MRLSAATAAVLTATALTFAGVGAGTALASPLSTDTGSSSSSRSSAVSEPGDLMLSSSAVRPGATVSFSGSFAEPAAQTATGISVTSSAFGGPATLDRTNPEAFSGSGTVAAGTTPGTYTVTASSSAGTVSAKLTVEGSSPVPPPHHGGHSSSGGSGSGGSAAGTSAGSDGGSGTIAATDTLGAVVPDGSGSVLPWVLGGVGVLALGGGAYAIGRGRAADRAREADLRDANRRRDQARGYGQGGRGQDDPRTEVMYRR